MRKSLFMVGSVDNYWPELYSDILVRFHYRSIFHLQYAGF